MKHPILYLLCWLITNITYAQEDDQEYIPYRIKNKWGFSDVKGKIIIQPQWDEVNFFVRDKTIVKFYDSTKNKMIHCLINRKGDYIIPPERNWNGAYRGWQSTMLNSHNKEGKYGLIDTNNQLLIPYEYDMPTHASYFPSKGLRTIEKKGMVGVIDTNNKVVIPFEFKEIKFLVLADGQKTLLLTRNNFLWTIRDFNNKKIIEDSFINAYSPEFYSGKIEEQRLGLILVKKKKIKVNSEYDRYIEIKGWYDLKTKKIIAPQYEKFIVLNNSYYEADGKVYDFNQKEIKHSFEEIQKIGGKLYGAYYVTKGSIIELKLTQLDSKTLQPTSIVKIIPYSDPIAADISSKSGAEYYNESAIPSQSLFNDIVIPGGESQLSFSRFKKSLSNDLNVLSFINKATNKYYNVVIDKQQKLIIPPFEDQGEIVFANFTDSILLIKSYVSPKSLWIQNFNGIIIDSINGYQVDAIFKHPAKGILMNVCHDTSQYGCAQYNYQSMNGNKTISLFYRSIIRELSGSIYQSLSPYQFISFLDSNGNISSSSYEMILVQDQNKKLGFVNINGKILLNDISFKFKRIRIYGLNLFLGYLAGERMAKLIDSSNHEIFANLEVLNILTPQEFKPDYGSLFNGKIQNNDILQVTFHLPNVSQSMNHVYINKNGTIYGQEL